MCSSRLARWVAHLPWITRLDGWRWMNRGLKEPIWGKNFFFADYLILLALTSKKNLLRRYNFWPYRPTIRPISQGLNFYIETFFFWFQNERVYGINFMPFKPEKLVCLRKFENYPVDNIHSTQTRLERQYVRLNRENWSPTKIFNLLLKSNLWSARRTFKRILRGF